MSLFIHSFKNFSFYKSLKECINSAQLYCDWGIKFNKKLKKFNDYNYFLQAKVTNCCFLLQTKCLNKSRRIN